MNRGKNLLLVLLIFTAGWLFMMNMGKVRAPVDSLMTASWMYAACALPFAVYYLRDEGNIPYIPVLCLIYFFYFGFSIFNNYGNLIDAGYTQEMIQHALSYCFYGILALLAAFYTPLGVFVDIMARPLKINWDPKAAYRMALGSVFLGFGVMFLSSVVRVSSAFSATFDMLNQFSRLGIIMLLILDLQGRLKRVMKILLWFVFIPLRLMFVLSSGSTLPVMIDLGILYFIVIYYKKTFPVVQGIVSVLLFFMIFSVRDDYRGELVTGRGAQRDNPIAKSAVYIDLIKEKLTLGGSQRGEHFEKAYGRFSSRTDNLATMTRVVSMTPTIVPYWNGYTYSTFLYSFIPRFILPDKPMRTMGQDFGHRYLILFSTDQLTSINLPILVEMYANYGLKGVIFGMFLLGLFLRWFYKTFNHEEAGDGGMVMTAMVLSNVLMFESDFCLMFAPVVEYIIIFYVILKRTKKKAPITG